MEVKPRRDVFQAIADPTRREILSLLTKKRRKVNSIAEHFNMTRQAVSLHVKILSECDVIEINKEGRERVCELKPQKLGEVDDWLEPFRKIMDEKFDRLDQLLTKMKNQEKP